MRACRRPFCLDSAATCHGPCSRDRETWQFRADYFEDAAKRIDSMIERLQGEAAEFRDLAKRAREAATPQVMGRDRL